MIGIGKVYLVGSGPGDPGLLTLRAKRLLELCDVLVYDNLVDERIVRSFTSDRCEKIYVGKSGASHTMEQDEINDLLVSKCSGGRIVVRLKGGDPFIFGRGGEEALHCAEQGIPFEVVSGVSSAYAVPASAGIPVTNRGYSSSVAFITGHEEPGKAESDIRWDRIATGVQTLVFLMGVKNLPSIVEQLTRNGLDATTPAAVIENGCGPEQRTVTGTLDDIVGKVTVEKIRPPSIIVIGDVVSLRERLSWYENRPLFGKTIIVTRSREQSSELTARLEELGARVIEAPVIRILPPENTLQLREAAMNSGHYDWIIFTSVNGVSYFFEHLYAEGLDARSLARCSICAIGTATGDVLMRHGIVADLIPERFVSEEVVRALGERGEIQDKSFLLPRADIAPKEMAETLRAGGASRVDDVVAYRTVMEESLLPEGVDFDLVTFTSSSTVRNFDALYRRGKKIGQEPPHCVAIGPITARTARELGYSVERVAEEHTIGGLVDAILSLYR